MNPQGLAGKSIATLPCYNRQSVKKRRSLPHSYTASEVLPVNTSARALVIMALSLLEYTGSGYEITAEVGSGPAQPLRNT